MINTTSRYKNATVTQVEDFRGVHLSVNPAAPVSFAFEFTYYMVEMDDEIDTLADYFLGSGQLWWVLANANPEILDWTNLEVGTIIRIPSVQ